MTREWIIELRTACGCSLLTTMKMEKPRPWLERCMLSRTPEPPYGDNFEMNATITTRSRFFELTHREGQKLVYIEKLD